MALLLVSPWVAWYVARETYRYDMKASAWEAQHRFQVSAVLLEGPAWSADDNSGEAPPPFAPAQATWVGPDGVARTGTVAADPHLRAGSKQTIWVDERGGAASPPVRRNPVFDGLMSAAIAVCALVGGLAGLHRILVWRLDRSRMNDWQAQWLIFEPQWRHR